jgi:hypothetical protein
MSIEFKITFTFTKRDNSTYEYPHIYLFSADRFFELNAEYYNEIIRQTQDKIQNIFEKIDDISIEMDSDSVDYSRLINERSDHYNLLVNFERVLHALRNHTLKLCFTVNPDECTNSISPHTYIELTYDRNRPYIHPHDIQALLDEHRRMQNMVSGIGVYGVIVDHNPNFTMLHYPDTEEFRYLNGDDLYEIKYQKYKKKYLKLKKIIM